MKKVILGILYLSFLTSCIEKNLYQAPEEKPVDAFFGFDTSSSCTVDLSYGFKDYLVIFELFEKNPLSEDENGNLVKTLEDPIYRGSTDKKGVFNDLISIPTYITELYLYSDFLGTISPIKLPIKDGKISFDQNAFKQSMQKARRSTRAEAANGYVYPDGYQILGSWNELGCPTYLSTFTSEIDAELLYKIRKVFLEMNGNESMGQKFPSYVADDVNIEINIKKPTTIGLVMLSTTATKQNTVGYFTYPTGQKPTDLSKITPIIAYPRISTRVCNSSETSGSMYMGDKVDLKYWDGEKFVNEFPEGVSIAWFLMESSFNTSTAAISKGTNTFCSIRSLNKNNSHRTVALKDASGQVVTFGMEDATNFANGDTKLGNFGDAVFYLEFPDGSSIETGGIKELPDATLETNTLYTSSKGVLAFEDQWPKQGDYDMNDMVVEYKRDIYKNILTKKVTKIVDTFMPKYDGATLHNGFGYQFTDIPDEDIKITSIESEGIISQFMKGQMKEDGQNYPTIILFDDMKTALNKTFTVTIEVAKEKYQEQSFYPFFNHPSWEKSKFNLNPFMIIDTPTNGRDKEAHIVKFPPTSKMNYSYFGQGFDASREEDGLYYVNNDNMPTGLQISGTNVGTKRSANFLIPIEGTSILEAYPKFGSWASSFGSAEAYWWKNPDNSKVITQ